MQRCCLYLPVSSLPSFSCSLASHYVSPTPRKPARSRFPAAPAPTANAQPVTTSKAFSTVVALFGSLCGGKKALTTLRNKSQKDLGQIAGLVRIDCFKCPSTMYANSFGKHSRTKCQVASRNAFAGPSLTLNDRMWFARSPKTSGTSYRECSHRRYTNWHTILATK